MGVGARYGHLLAPDVRIRGESPARAGQFRCPVSYHAGPNIYVTTVTGTAAGLNFSRQIIASCDAKGECDIAAMDIALNAYLRRHDTFRSWFERTGDGEFIRHTITDPADIEFEPVNHGHLTVDEIREHTTAIPNPLEWGCFTFGVVQREGQFTFFVAMDHVHGDATLIGTTMIEANGMYAALSSGGEALELPDAGSFDDFCVRERESTSAFTLDSPGVQTWIDFAENNNGAFPEFPLPLGDPEKTTSSEMSSELLMDPAQDRAVRIGVRYGRGALRRWPVRLSRAGGARIHRRSHLLRPHAAGFPHRRRQLHDPRLVHRPDPDHGAHRRDLVQRGGVRRPDVIRLGSGHGAGAVLPSAGVGAVVEVATTELSGVELPAWRGRAAQRYPRGRRPGPGGQHRDLSRWAILLPADYVHLPVQRGHGDGDHASRQPHRPEVGYPLHGGNAVRVRAGRGQRTLGTRRLTWAVSMSEASQKCASAGWDSTTLRGANIVGERRRRAHTTAPTGGEGLMRRLADFVVRWPWVVIAAWVAIAVALPLSFPSLNEMSEKHPLSILPSDAPSNVTARKMTEAFHESGSEDLLLVVLTDDKGLSHADEATYRALVDTLRKDTRNVVMLQDFITTPPLKSIVTSKDNKAWMLPVGVAGELGTPRSYEACLIRSPTSSNTLSREAR